MTLQKILFQQCIAKSFKPLWFALLMFLPLLKIHAQNVQIGISGGITNTIFRKSASSFGNSKFYALPMPGIAFSLPVFFKFSPVLSLKTGIGYQSKRYRVEQRDFDADGLKGRIFYGAAYNVGELPILLSFKPLNGKKYRLEYSAGCVLTYNSPSSTTSGSGITGSDSTTSIRVSSDLQQWKNTFSPDLYIGISLGNYKNNFRNYQLTLSYQHGLAQLDPSSFSTEIVSGSLTKKETIVLNPLLSGFTFTYTYFPKFFNFK